MNRTPSRNPQTDQNSFPGTHQEPRIGAALPIVSLKIGQEQDIVLGRQRTRQLAMLCGFDAQDQTRLATAVSEILRNAFRYAGGGSVEFSLSTPAPHSLRIRVEDQGPGIADLDEILSGRYRSQTGMGMGLIGARRLLDKLDINTVPGRGTTVVMEKALPRPELLSPDDMHRLVDQLLQETPENPFLEIQRQNQELLQALDALRERQEELAHVNRELAETNRGVMALYAELDEKNKALELASTLKSRFLSHMSHEFRTPLASILGLSRLLLDGVDGELSAEQEKQVRFIRQGATNLQDMVNDLLDLAKIEAGRTDMRATTFTVGGLFSALRGMFRPLLTPASPSLFFDVPDEEIEIYTDDAKLSQILRNLLSNSLKFTECGEVRVSATCDGGMLVLSVRDTGIGLTPVDQERIFDEFQQVESPLQLRAKGTGLGLPLSRHLAELLGGSLTVTSTFGAGSTFRLQIPLVYASPDFAAASPGGLQQSQVPNPERKLDAP